MTVSNQAKAIIDQVKESGLTQDDLRAINETVVKKSRDLQRAKTKSFYKGQKVRINSNGNSNGTEGIIQKVNQKTIIVRDKSDNINWKVSPGLLEPVES